jgi:hypothetical protein
MMGQFGYQGLAYGPALVQTISQNRETISADFTGYIAGAFKSNGPVFSCVLARMWVFSEARFQFRQMNNGRPGKLFGTNDLQILEEPWPGGTTGDLLMRMELDASLAGNYYGTLVPDRRTKSGKRVQRLRPDWVTIILGSENDNGDQTQKTGQFDPNASLVGYVYQPGGANSGYDPKFFLPEEVCHWAPIPDPAAWYRGMSWIEPVITEVMGDKSQTTHKLMFFENGASPNLVVSMETGKMDRKTFKEWVDTFENEHVGSTNAYKTLYLGQGANAEVVGTNLRDLDYSVTQGHGESRIAAAAGIPPIVVGFSEGLEAATYSNYAQARRAWADRSLRPNWRSASSALAWIVNVPGGAMLWYDDRDIAFLQADAQDAAEIQVTQATAIRLLVDAGYDPDSIVEAIAADDFTLLKHSGLYSVQLQPPNNNPTSPTDPQNAPANGNGNGNGVPTQNGNKANSGHELLKTAAGRATILTNGGNVQAFAQALKAAKAMDNSK